MAVINLKNLGLFSRFAPGSDGWGMQMEFNLRALDGFSQFIVQTLGAQTYPSYPQEGEMYILGEVTGVPGFWTGQSGKVARYGGIINNYNLGVVWDFWEPKEGWICYVLDRGEFYYYTGVEWVSLSASPIDMMASLSGPIAANAVLLGATPFARRVVFPANFAGSYAVCQVPPSIDVGFTVYRNNDIVGSITFPENGSSGVFASSGGAPVVYEPGNTIRIAGGPLADTTFSGVGLALSGTK